MKRSELRKIIEEELYLIKEDNNIHTYEKKNAKIKLTLGKTNGKFWFQLDIDGKPITYDTRPLSPKGVYMKSMIDLFGINLNDYIE